MISQKVNVAAVLDEFDNQCFKYECRFFPLTPDNWHKLIETNNLDFIIIGTTWRGYQESWHKIFDPVPGPDNPLYNIINYCQLKKIPLIFYNKEDPLFFDKYLNLARECNYIFTTDRNCIAKYEKALGHKRVYELPFGVQPLIHNPIGRQQAKKNIAFAGNWYPFPERRRDMKMLFDQAINYGLDIYPRTTQFPEKYQQFLCKSQSYEQILKIYKKYHVFLNVNTIKNSPTMMARRVMELMACGTIVVSNESAAIRNLLGEDIVFLCKTKQEVSTVLKRVLNDSDLREKIALKGQRKVFCEHTMKRRFHEILVRIGFIRIRPVLEKVTIITQISNPGNINNVLSNFRQQNYPQKELIIVLNGYFSDKKALAQSTKDIQIIYLNKKVTVGESLNLAIRRASGDIIARFNEQDYYAPDYLTDMVNCFLYANTEVIGKLSSFIYFRRKKLLALYKPGYEYSYGEFIRGGTLVARKSVFDQVQFDKLDHGEDTQFNLKCRRKGIKFYISDHFNYVTNRFANPDLNSWKIDDHELLSKCQQKIATTNFQPIISV